jgi:hypothetical protein
MAACGDLPIAALAGRRVRDESKSWRDRYADTPRKADFAWTVLARLLSFAKDRGIIAGNPCEKGGRLYVADRRDKAWNEEDIASLLSVASKEIQLALMLAIWTGAGHPLQAGFLTSAAGKGASIFKMMDVSRHKSVDTLRDHVRDAELFKDHAAAGLL